MPAPAGPGLIEVKVQSMHQLFNSMDPSPFHERDLDHDAEEFIVSWAREHPRNTPLKLVVHLAQAPAEGGGAQVIADSIHNYFDYRSEINRHDLRRLLREGWTSLLTGLSFLAACMLASQAFAARTDWRHILAEGFTIIGWVAMWHPLEIYLYLWWPLRRLGVIYRKLAEIPIEVRIGGGAPG